MTKQIIIAVIIIIVAFVGYNMFFVNDDSTSSALVSDIPNQQEFVDGQLILLLLNNLNKVTLDDSIFSNSVFVSLQSFERALEEQVPGRRNPFLPIGVNNPLSATTSRPR